MKKLIFGTLSVLLVLCIRINASDDFCIRLDMNKFGYEAFSSDGWTTNGDVAVINKDAENFLKIGTNSDAIYTPDAVIGNNRVVFSCFASVEQSGGFVGFYINNESGRTCFSLAFNKNNEIAVYTTGGWKTLCSYEAGALYNLKCVIDNEHNTFGVSVDGVEYIKDAPLRNKAGIKEVKIYTENTSALVKDLALYSGKVSGISINSSEVYGDEIIAPGRDLFEIFFSDDMNSDTLNGDTVILRDKNGVNIPYNGEYIAEKRSFILRPQKLYHNKDGLQVVIKGTNNGVRATDGGMISGGSYILEFDVSEKAVTISDVCTQEDKNIVKLSFSVENMCDIVKKQKVIIAEYSVDKLIGLKTYAVEEAQKSQVAFEAEYTADDEKNQLYAFIFDLEDMIPITERIQLKSQEMSE